MPIYEFYCEDCHAVFNFFSQRVNTKKHPDCPKCGRLHLERKVSVFSVAKNRPEGGANPFDGIDESQLEQAMMAMAGELEGLDQEKPQQAASVVRSIMDQAGIKLGGGVEEAIGRLEAGDDPDEIEANLSDAFDDDANLFSVKPSNMLGSIRRKYLPPKTDPTLYDL
jgi:putative FmdB family regulatory protein